MLCGLSSLSQAGDVPVLKRAHIEVNEPNNRLQNDLYNNVKRYRQTLRDTGVAPDLNRLASGERQRLERLLAAQGYYQPEVIYTIIEPRNQPSYIRYQISPGNVYRIADIRLQGWQSSDMAWQTLQLNDPISTQEVLAEQDRLAQNIAENHCFFRIDVTHQVSLDHRLQSASIVYLVNAEQPSRVGQLSFSANAGVRSQYLRQQTGLRSGDCFRRADIDQSVLNLYQTQLFSSVQRQLTRQQDGSVDIHYEFMKRPPRTLNASTGWDSSESFNLKLGWQHRNLFGFAQWLSVSNELQFSLFDGLSIRQSISDLSLTLPGFQAAPNTLILAANYTFVAQPVTNTPGNQFRITETSATLNRQASRRETYRYRIALRRTDERIGQHSRRLFHSLRFPFSYVTDDNPTNFNPTSGQRLRVQLEPVISIREDGYSFLRTELGWSSYRPLGQRLVLATDSEWRSVWRDGQSLTRIPESDRYRLGGGGSLRGYPFQSIGTDKQASAGLQSLQATVELRAQLSATWGLTLFSDAGIVSDQVDAFWRQPWSAGTGVGVRYFTPFAPVRLDIAMPLHQDDNLDPYQLYISLGQAF